MDERRHAWGWMCGLALTVLLATGEAAAFPAKSLLEYKFWPHVARVDNVFGDRNLVCSCVGMEAYSS